MCQKMLTCVREVHIRFMKVLRDPLETLSMMIGESSEEKESTGKGRMGVLCGQRSP